MNRYTHLPQHCGSQRIIAVLCGDQVGNPQENGRPVIEGGLFPFLLCFNGNVDRLLYQILQEAGEEDEIYIKSRERERLEHYTVLICRKDPE